MAIVSIITRAATRTAGRFQSLYETLQEEYWKTHQHFERHGCSLHPKDVSRRSSFTAWVATIIIFLVTIPAAIFYRGIDVFNAWFLFGIVCDFLAIWCLFYTLVIVAHCLFAITFITGNRFGSSKMFLNYVGNRWGKRIDKIADKFIAENGIILEKSLQVSDKGACGDYCDGSQNQVLGKLATEADKEEDDGILKDEDVNEPDST